MVMATVVRAPTAITIYPCGHEIDHMSELIDVPALDPLSPGEWLTAFLAAADDT
ncbi:hypothetical protein SAMN05421858_3370 [Haladaptatus litoreus]|uniref:Uncharacterized protein n=2 Tax=Haladaptatus litoreus TaxID=553468 RepID=A0A1N7D019_9EURY|nr:hypothetical protein SAMN05421858_3370 [Haladaptatus litoreus]